MAELKRETPRFGSKLRRRRSRRSAGGFTLVEAMVALAVMVVGIVPMVTLMIAGRRLDQQAEVQAVALNVARQQLETIRALNYLDRPSDGISRSFPIPTNVQTEFPNYSYTGATANFTGSYVVSPGTVPNTQEIVVTISWLRSGSLGDVSTATLDTIDAKGAGN